jgi:hypothetical protein
MKSNPTAKLIVVLAVSLLPGCAVPVVVSAITGAASLAVNEVTGKSVTDHTVSSVNNQDCKVIRVFRDQNICQDRVPETKFQAVATGVTPSTVEEIQSRYR